MGKIKIMRAFSIFILSVISGVFLSMTLAIYLPLEQVNRMFISGLATPLIICSLSVLSVRLEKLRAVLLTHFSLIPSCAFLVFSKLL